MQDVCSFANCPVLVVQEHIRLFAYYWEGEVCTGMMWQGRIFGLHTCLTEHQRHRAHEIGKELSAQADVVISRAAGSSTQYYLWLDLATLKNSSLLNRGMTLPNAAPAKVTFDPTCVRVPA